MVKRTNTHKTVAVILAVALLLGSIIGGTLAWLTAKSSEVKNTFTESGIEIELKETGLDETGTNEFKMIPGWMLEKDPNVTVSNSSEDCWLFVKIIESTDLDLDDYIVYEINDKYDEVANPNGWQIIQAENEKGEIVIGRKVYQDDTSRNFSLLGSGSYTDSMGTETTEDDYTVTWKEKYVCVKPSVTEEMMEAISSIDISSKTYPTLTFQAYAVQLFKTNSDGDKANTDDEFTVEEAWTRANNMIGTN